MPKYNLIIEKTTKASGLSLQEKSEIEKELKSHFFEVEKDLNLKGRKSKEAINNFGDPKLVGHQIRQAHRKYEQIPVLGDLIYYLPFKLGIILSFKIFIYFIISFSVFYYAGNIWSFGEKGSAPIFLLGALHGLIIFSFPVIIAIYNVFKINKRLKRYKNILTALITSVLPYLFILSITIIPEKIQYGSNGDDNIEIYLLVTFLVVFYSIFIITFLLLKIINKYLYAKEK